MTPAPKFQKRSHHVVPRFWQKAFTAPGGVGPYYLNVVDGRRIGPVGPGDKMAEDWVNIVFDAQFRPSDALEDWLGTKESLVSAGLQTFLRTGALDDVARQDIAMLLGLQICRDPDEFGRRLERGHLLALALNDADQYDSVSELNAVVSNLGMDVAFTAIDLAALQNQDPEERAAELQQLLDSHGYEDYLNPSDVLAAALPVAERLMCRDWTIIKADTPSFVLSDRPVPTNAEDGFAVSLTGSAALLVAGPSAGVGAVEYRDATTDEISSINATARASAKEWICGPGSFIFQM